MWGIITPLWCMLTKLMLLKLSVLKSQRWTQIYNFICLYTFNGVCTSFDCTNIRIAQCWNLSIKQWNVNSSENKTLFHLNLRTGLKNQYANTYNEHNLNNLCILQFTLFSKYYIFCFNFKYWTHLCCLCCVIEFNPNVLQSFSSSWFIHSSTVIVAMSNDMHLHHRA